MQMLHSFRGVLRTIALPLAATVALPVGSGCRTTAPAPEHTGRAPSRFADQAGLQLYSLRRELKQDLDGTLAAVAAMGFKEVEVPDLYGMAASELRTKIESHGLHVRGFMAIFERMEAELDQVVADAKALGADFVVCPWIPHGDSFDAEDMNKALALFRRAGQSAKANGMRFAYHLHGYEFQGGGNGGTDYVDQMIGQTTPGEVDFEMDVYWVVFAGADPLHYLKRYPGRFPLLHVKDMKKGTPTGVKTGKGDVEDTTQVGTGQIDFPPILKAAQAQGTKWFFIEDESSAATQHLPGSLNYLLGLKI